MTAAAEPRLRLAHKLALAVLALASALLLALLLFVGPRTTQGFLVSSTQLLDQGSAAMRELTTEHAQESRAILVDLIAHTTDARRRALADLPLDLFADLSAVRTYVQHEDEQRAERLRQNVATLAAEMQRRADLRIDAVLADLQRRQRDLAGEFAGAVQWTHVTLCALLLAVALPLLGFGLHRLVVRPVAVLRAATHRIADGELGTAIEAHSADEIGALAADFARMVAQLQKAQQALAELNRDLERRVDEKTRALAHAEKMVSLGTLAGGIAHEFNNLIGGIRGCAQQVRTEVADPDQRETLDVILRATDRAADVVAQLRRFAKKEAPRERELDLAGVLADALRLIEPEARRRGVAIERDFEPLPLRGDDGGLHQVFVNLFTNALQAMPGGGTLAVRGRCDDAGVIVAVRDTGVGIAEVDRARIFEPFFTRRADDADPAQRGTGLGLSVSYGIVDAHGGTIEVASSPGAGTTFTVRLPKRR